MKQSDIIKFAQSSIYDTADYLGKWEGFAIYDPGWDDDEPHCTGFPSFILAKGDTKHIQ